MKLEKKSQSKAYFIYVVAIALVLVLCTGIFLTYSWLKTSITITNDTNNASPISDPTTHLGTVDVEVYFNNAQVSRIDTTPIVITSSGSNATRSINLTVRNMGTIDALIRATISIYYLDANNNRVTYLLVNSPTAENQCKMTNLGWVNSLAGDNAVADGYTFYNAKIQPYIEKTADNRTGTAVPAHEVPIMTQVILGSEFASKTFYIDVKIDACAYAGNIYKKVQAGETSASEIPVSAYPFGPKENLPIAWTAWQ